MLERSTTPPEADTTRRVVDPPVPSAVVSRILGLTRADRERSGGRVILITAERRLVGRPFARDLRSMVGSARFCAHQRYRASASSWEGWVVLKGDKEGRTGRRLLLPPGCPRGS